MTLKEINYNLVNLAFHLGEAGKYMMIFNKDKGIEMLKMAETLLQHAEAEEEKVPQEKLDSIIDEIMKIDSGE